MNVPSYAEGVNLVANTAPLGLCQQETDQLAYSMRQQMGLGESSDRDMDTSCISLHGDSFSTKNNTSVSPSQLTPTMTDMEKDQEQSRRRAPSSFSRIDGFDKSTRTRRVRWASECTSVTDFTSQKLSGPQLSFPESPSLPVAPMTTSPTSVAKFFLPEEEDSAQSVSKGLPMIPKSPSSVLKKTRRFVTAPLEDVDEYNSEQIDSDSVSSSTSTSSSSSASGSKRRNEGISQPDASVKRRKQPFTNLESAEQNVDDIEDVWYEMQRMEAKIRQASKLESKALRKAKKLRQRRKLLMHKYQELEQMATTFTNDISSAELGKDESESLVFTPTDKLPPLFD